MKLNKKITYEINYTEIIELKISESLILHMKCIVNQSVR